MICVVMFPKTIFKIFVLRFKKIFMAENSANSCFYLFIDFKKLTVKLACFSHLLD